MQQPPRNKGAHLPNRNTPLSRATGPLSAFFSLANPQQKTTKHKRTTLIGTALSYPFVIFYSPARPLEQKHSARNRRAEISTITQTAHHPWRKKKTGHKRTGEYPPAVRTFFFVSFLSFLLPTRPRQARKERSTCDLLPPKLFLRLR